VTPPIPLAISSAALRSSALDTLPRSVMTPAYVSTLMCRPATRLSKMSDDLAFVVIQESFIM
jgi:hypothetical protein